MKKDKEIESKTQTQLAQLLLSEGFKLGILTFVMILLSWVLLVSLTFAIVLAYFASWKAAAFVGGVAVPLIKTIYNITMMICGYRPEPSSGIASIAKKAVEGRCSAITHRLSKSGSATSREEG